MYNYGLTNQFLRTLMPYLKGREIKTILDLGSRDLTQSIELHLAFPKAKIYAFEAHPGFAAQCRERNLPYVEVFDEAVMDFTGEIPFYATPFNLSASSIFKPARPVLGVDISRNIEEVTVPCIRIDEWAKEAGVEQIDLVWMDVQGAEIPALKGFGDLLSNVLAIHTEVETSPVYHDADGYSPTLREQLTDFLSPTFKEKAFTKNWECEGDAIYINRSAL